MDELRNRATKFMHIEEHIDYHRSHQAKSMDKGKENEKSYRPMPGWTNRFRENREPRFNSYTPLTILKGKILDEVLQAELIPTLKSSQTPQNADTSKCCQYHRNYGHTTEECQALEDKVEERIQDGHLCQFIKIDTSAHC